MERNMKLKEVTQWVEASGVLPPAPWCNGDWQSVMALLARLLADNLIQRKQSQEMVDVTFKIAFDSMMQLAQDVLGIPMLVTEADLPAAAPGVNLALLTTIVCIKSSVDIEPKIIKKAIIPKLVFEARNSVARKEQLTVDCAICMQHVFIIERIVVDHVIYHRKCFTCARCDEILRNGLYRQLKSGKFECIEHWPQAILSNVEKQKMVDVRSNRESHHHHPKQKPPTPPKPKNLLSASAIKRPSFISNANPPEVLYEEVSGNYENNHFATVVTSNSSTATELTSAISENIPSDHSTVPETTDAVTVESVCEEGMEKVTVEDEKITSSEIESDCVRLHMRKANENVAIKQSKLELFGNKVNDYGQRKRDEERRVVEKDSSLIVKVAAVCDHEVVPSSQLQAPVPPPRPKRRSILLLTSTDVASSKGASVTPTPESVVSSDFNQQKPTPRPRIVKTFDSKSLQRTNDAAVTSDGVWLNSSTCPNQPPLISNQNSDHTIPKSAVSSVVDYPNFLNPFGSDDDNDNDDDEVGVDSFNHFGSLLSLKESADDSDDSYDKSLNPFDDSDLEAVSMTTSTTTRSREVLNTRSVSKNNSVVSAARSGKKSPLVAQRLPGVSNRPKSQPPPPPKPPRPSLADSPSPSSALLSSTNLNNNSSQSAIMTLPRIKSKQQHIPVRRKIIFTETEHENSGDDNDDDKNLQLEAIMDRVRGIDKELDVIELNGKCIEKELLFAIEQNGSEWVKNRRVDDWITVIERRCELDRRQSAYIMKWLERYLNEIHSDTEYQLRCLIENVATADRAPFNVEREAKLLELLVEIINEKNRLIESKIDSSAIIDCSSSSIGIMQNEKDETAKKRIKKRLKKLRRKIMAFGGKMSSREMMNIDFESIRTGVVFDEGMGRVVPPNLLYGATAAQSPKSQMNGYEIVIEQTWDGHPVTHDPIRVRMEWHFERQPGRPHKRCVRVLLESPLFDDPDPPPQLPGICPGLWNYEVVELFFANAKKQYLEVEVGPHGHWLCVLLDGVRKPFNTGEELQLEVQNTFVGGDIWRCCFDIPLAYFPAGVETFNAYAIHGSGEERVYEAYSPVTDGSYDEPDFHRLQFFKRIDIRRLIPEGFNSSSYNDLKYGDVWEGR
ncbi:unnamed protein product [Anisakis simplex]|uniref:LIM zinc-binding domain-containing protein n=1 Tax=Anisakis simplex TaxID=6269 RepID=A0A3P6PXX3_ANISI|nr:unnamed protein product [Anisakis simplex]